MDFYISKVMFKGKRKMGEYLCFGLIARFHLTGGHGPQPMPVGLWWIQVGPNPSHRAWPSNTPILGSSLKSRVPHNGGTSSFYTHPLNFVHGTHVPQSIKQKTGLSATLL